MIHELAEKIIENIFDILIVVDKAFTIIDANNAVSEIGYKKEQLIGLNALNLISNSDDLEAAIPELVSASAKGTRIVRRFEMIKADKARLFVDMTAREIDGNYLLTFHDVDERAKARKELEEQKRRIEEVFAETDRLRKEAEESKLQLQVANEQLEKRQASTEAALLKEQEFNLNSQKTGYQKQIILWMIGLVGFVMFIPYVTGFLTVNQKAVEGSVNNMPLVIQILSMGIAAMFGQQMEKSKKE